MIILIMINSVYILSFAGSLIWDYLPKNVKSYASLFKNRLNLLPSN